MQILTDPYPDIVLKFSIPKWDCTSLKISFHLGLNGVSSPLFAMAGIVGLSAGWVAIHSGAKNLKLFLALLLFMQSD